MNARDLQGAADVLAREAKRFEGLAAAAKSLGEAAGIVNRIEEAGRTLADLVDEVAKEREELRKVQIDRQLEVEASKKEVMQAGADAVAAKREGQELAEQFIREAQTNAAKLVEDARGKAAAMIATSESRVLKLNAELADKGEVIDGLAAEIAQKSATLKDIENRIASAREKIAAFAG